MELTGQFRIWPERERTTRKRRSWRPPPESSGKPFHEVLIDDVAAEAGVGKGTIYRYFETKEDLFFAAILHSFDELSAALGESLAHETSPRRRLERIAREVLSFSWERRELFSLLLSDERRFAKRDEDLRKRRETVSRLAQEAILEGCPPARVPRHRRTDRRRALSGNDPRRERPSTSGGHVGRTRLRDRRHLHAGNRKGARVRRLRPATVAAAGLAALLAAAGCASRDVNAHVAPGPSAPWQPPPEGRMPPPVPTPAVAIPEQYLRPGATLSLEQVIDVALSNNPVTRTAWYQARAAAANLGAKKSAYLPDLELHADITRQKQTSVGSRFVTLQTTYGPSLNLSWLLFDVGGRAADVDEARHALFVADWTHDAVIQNLVLQVEIAFYQYQNAKGQALAAEVTLKQAQESLAAADERHRSGVATIADVLQARTAVSQAELALETARGAIQTLRGALATAAGVSPNVPVDVAELPRDVSVEEVAETVDVLIDRAQSQRPDLAAARFEVLRAQSHVRSVRAEGLPSLSAAGSASRVYFYNSTGLPFANNYSGSILFRFPVFTGGRNTYETLEAREQARAAEGQAETPQAQVVLQVWTSYYNLRTAAQRVKTARDLLASATQSQEVAAGRYKAGVGSIIDLLVAQSAYANALAQETQARSDWFVALAMLAHDTGSLGPPPATPPPATPGQSGGAVP